ncbi:MAG: hypothetical protein N2517_00115 [Ignavibacteria bacterium]|nr:hypothetical protein [Ignavibacteria bacterium]
MSLLFLLFIGCELIRITEKAPTNHSPDPAKSIGVVILLKKELEKNNFLGATKLFLSNTTNISTDNYFELEDKLKRLSSLISSRSITHFKVDTLSLAEHRVLVEFDYIFEYYFLTKQLDDQWFILRFEEIMR